MRRWIPLADEAATCALGSALAAVARPGLRVYLRGALGAGKTTLARACLRALGHEGPVRSPTYTLVETYRAAGLSVHHFDLYRLADPEELEFIGIRDYLDGEAVILVEWPERAAGLLPEPGLDIVLEHTRTGRVAHVAGQGEWMRDFAVACAAHGLDCASLT